METEPMHPIGTASARYPALLALGLPVLAGIAYLWFGGAPSAYPVINGVALIIGWTAIMLPVFAPGEKHRRIVICLLLVMLVIPLATGPHLNGIARWLPLGPFQLHAGSLVLPSIAVLAAREPEFAPSILLVALFAAFVQPDAATGYAVMFAAAGLYNATRDWRQVPVVGVSFLASIIAGFRGELPAQEFVERVLVDLSLTAPLIALLLLATLIGSFFAMVHTLHAPHPERHALAGSLFGFSLAGLVSNYPSVLIGYGAAPIIGFGLALALSRQGCSKRSAASVTD